MGEQPHSAGVPITEENYLTLRKAYRKAVKAGQKEFWCFKHQWLVDFAKYMLEYMETFAHIKPLIDQPDK
jgi:hypothetical protein